MLANEFEAPCNSDSVPERGDCSVNGLCKVNDHDVNCTSCVDGFAGNGFICRGLCIIYCMSCMHIVYTLL